MFPQKLKSGDEIRIIAPSRSLSLLSEESIEKAKKRLEQEGFKVTFSKNCSETDEFTSSSIQSRIDDLHDAFKDKNVKAILTVIGGFNSNQLLKYIDYDLIHSNPKILCGFSDITALANAIHKKTGLVTYSGLHFSTFAMQNYFDYNLEYFKKCLMENSPFEVISSKIWTDDEWYLSEDNRTPEENEGYWLINEGSAEAKIIGGNQCTLNLLQGTEYMPDISDSILFLEDDDEVEPHHFDRDLQSLIHLPNFKTVKGIVIGRFQKESKITRNLLEKIIRTKKELENMPVIANANFGHTNPAITFPIGGKAKIIAEKDNISIKILNH